MSVLLSCHNSPCWYDSALKGMLDLVERTFALLSIIKWVLVNLSHPCPFSRRPISPLSYAMFVTFPFTDAQQQTRPVQPIDLRGRPANCNQVLPRRFPLTECSLKRRLPGCRSDRGRWQGQAAVTGGGRQCHVFTSSYLVVTVVRKEKYSKADW